MAVSSPALRRVHAAPASVWFESGNLYLLVLENATPEGVSALVDGPDLPRQGERGRLHLQLGSERLADLGTVVRSANAQTRRVEFDLEQVPLDPGIALARWACQAAHQRSRATLAHREDLRSEAERASVLRFLVESAATGTVHTPEGECQLTARTLDARSQAVSWEFRGPTPIAPFLIELEGYNSLYRIPVPACRVQGARLETARPPWIEAIRFRRGRRVPAGADVSIAFDHPLWPTLRVERAMLDLTRNGLSFAAAQSRETVYPGLEIPNLLVVTGSGESIALRATVRSARGPVAAGVRAREQNSEAASFGCEVSPVSGQDAARWLKLCEARLFPSTRRGAAEVWSVYRSSGYLELSHTLEGAFDHLRSAYVNASRALSSAPDLGCQATWPADGPPKATVTNLRLTPSCWFSYHLAAQPDESLSARSVQVLRDLYCQYIEHCLATPGPRWQMAYVQHSAHWSMRVHVDIPRRYVAHREAWVQDFRALEVRTVGRAAAPNQRFAARRAHPSEREQALSRLATKLSPIYYEALDYAPEHFFLEAFKAEWARHGLERDRELLVAYDGDGPCAVGVVECAEPGLHLFGLLDTLRLYALTEGGVRAFPSLLDLAREWFRERGRRSFCYLEEEGQIAADGRHVKPMSPAFLTLLSVERLPEMLEQLHADTARL